MKATRRVTLDLSASEWKQLERLVTKTGSSSKAEALRKAIKEALGAGDTHRELQKALQIIETLVSKLPNLRKQ